MILLPSNITTISKRSRNISLADILYSGECRSILCTIVVGQIKKILSSSPSSHPTFNSVWKNGNNSPSFVTWNTLAFIYLYISADAKHTYGSLLTKVKDNLIALLHLPFDHLCADVSLNDVTLAHIANTKHETRLAISLTDDSIPREEKCLRAFFGTWQLREHDADHERLQDYSGHRLDAHREDRLRTHVRRMLRSVSTSLIYLIYMYIIILLV